MVKKSFIIVVLLYKAKERYIRMKILIIGGSGFIGQTIEEIAKEKGYSVISTGCYHIKRNFIKYNMLYDNIMDILKEFDILPQDVFIIICAAISRIDQCYLNQEESYSLNVIATKKLMNILSENHYKFGFISSDAVFDGKSGYYTEKSISSSQSQYGRQKAEIENYILKNMPNNLIFRISILLDDKIRKGNILRDFYLNAIENKIIYCMKDRIFCPTYVKDIANIIIMCFEKGLKGIYNVANQEIFSRRELAELFIKKCGYNTLIEEKLEEWFQFKDKRHHKTCLISEKLQNELNYKFISVEEIIEKFIEKNKLE